MKYVASLYLPFLDNDGETLYNLALIPNDFNIDYYKKGVLYYEKEFTSKTESVSYILYLMEMLRNSFSDIKTIFFNNYNFNDFLEKEIVSSLTNWKNKDLNSIFKDYYYNFFISNSSVFFTDATGEIIIKEKLLKENFEIYLTEEEYVLINSNNNFNCPVTYGDIKEAILNCYKNKKELKRNI